MPNLFPSVAILAGGQSTRLGTDKAFVTVAGKPLIEHVLARVVVLGLEEIIVVANRTDHFAYLNLPVYPDILPGKGSLGGIYTAIHHSQSEYTLVVACDMPFLNTALLQYLVALCDGSSDVIVPRVKGQPQGLHAAYNKACLAPIRRDLEANRLKVIGFYPSVNVRYLDEQEHAHFDPKGWSFFNINTPQDLTKARDL